VVRRAGLGAVAGRGAPGCGARGARSGAGGLLATVRGGDARAGRLAVRGGASRAARRRPAQCLQVVGEAQLIQVTQYQVDAGDCGDRLGVDLGVAAGHHHPAPGIQPLGQPDLVATGSVALGGHGAGVDHSDIGGLIPVDQPVPRTEKGLLHLGGFALVELAPDGAEGHSPRRRGNPPAGLCASRMGVESGRHGRWMLAYTA
jgi:hypothetical protein